MTDRELLQQALDALNAVTKELLACRGELAERGARPETPHKQKLWDSAFNAYTGMAIPTYEAMRARLAQPAQEPVAWMHPERRTYTRAPAMSITPKEDWIPLYTAPPQREWEGLTQDERMSIINKLAGQDWVYVIDAIEAKLKEKNT